MYACVYACIYACTCICMYMEYMYVYTCIEIFVQLGYDELTTGNIEQCEFRRLKRKIHVIMFVVQFYDF